MPCPPVSSCLWLLFSRLCLPCTKCWLTPGPGPRLQPPNLLVRPLSACLSRQLHILCWPLWPFAAGWFCPRVPNLSISLPPMHPHFSLSQGLCTYCYGHLKRSSARLLPSLSHQLLCILQHLVQVCGEAACCPAEIVCCCLSQ